MKKAYLKWIPALSMGLLILSCNDESSKTTETTATDTTTQVTQAPETPAAPAGTMNEFVTKAAQGGMMEVEMGKLAQANGNSKEVKDFGKMMETDHSSANSTLQGIAAAENISIPSAMSEEQAKHMQDMQAMKGAEFDKHYIGMMVDDHGKDIDLFKKAADGNENAKVKEFAAQTLPTLQKHLDKAKALKAKMK